MSSKGLSIPKQYELEDLARKIKASHQATCQMAKQIREQCNEAVAEAILCGQALIRAKEICGHGRFLAWLKEKCPKIETRTAQNYMRLANTKHVSYLERASTLRQAYLMVGVIQDKEQVTKKTEPARVEASDAPDKAEAAQRNGKAVTNSRAIVQTTTVQSRSVRTETAPKQEVRPAAQPLILRPVPTATVSAPPVAPPPPAGSKRLRHLKTLVASITDILGEFTPTEEPAAMEALRPICDWAARRQSA